MSDLKLDQFQSTQATELLIKQLRAIHGVEDGEQIPPQLLQDLLTALHSSSTETRTETSFSTKQQTKAKLIEEVRKPNSDIDEVVNLIRAGAGPNTVDPESNESVLQLACHKTDLQLVATLLEQGAGVLLKGANERTALHEATLYSSPLVADLLLEAGSTRYINEPDANGNTPILEACKRNLDDDQIKIIETLLEAGASMLDVNQDGETSLILAVKHNNPNLIDLTLDLNVDPNSIDSSGKTALCHAYEQENSAAFERLYRITDEKSSTLLAAVRCNDLDMIRRLKKQNVEHKFDISVDPESITTELMELLNSTIKPRTRSTKVKITAEQKKRVLEILDLGLNPNQELRPEHPKYLLDFSLAANDIQFFKDLINKGAKKLSYNDSLLTFMRSHSEFLALMEEHKLDKEQKLFTELFKNAIEAKNLETLRALAERIDELPELRKVIKDTVNPNELDDPTIVDTLVPLLPDDFDSRGIEDWVYKSITRDKPNFELARAYTAVPNFFKQKNSSDWDHILFRVLFPRHEQHRAQNFNDVDMAQRLKIDRAQFLLDSGANLDVPRYNGNRLIHYAIAKDDYETLEWLLSNGADIDCLVTDDGKATEFPAYHAGSYLDGFVGERRANCANTKINYSIPVFDEEQMNRVLSLIRKYHPNFEPHQKCQRLATYHDGSVYHEALYLRRNGPSRGRSYFNPPR